MDFKNSTIVTPKKRIDYRATLLEVPVGESRRIKIVGKGYSGYTTAASRLRSLGYDFRIESQDDSTILVKRFS